MQCVSMVMMEHLHDCWKHPKHNALLVSRLLDCSSEAIVASAAQTCYTLLMQAQTVSL